MTVYCSICDKKLGIFDRKYDVLDENGNLVKCCKDCKIAYEEEVRKKTEHEEAIRKKVAPEEKISDEGVRKENIMVMKDIISKYLKKKGLVSGRCF